ncbi:MAG TPA: hypothetical protein DCE58_05750 [Cryomorphaceae bacterium]|nr:hypothetical protein [Cryomorphaceae bacterium]
MRESFARWAFRAVVILWGFSGCDTRSIDEPAYLHVEALAMQPDANSTYGNTSSKITTVWIEVDGVNLGAHHLPVTLPVLIDQEGPAEVLLYPGININGISSFRGIYPFYTEYKATVNLQRGKTAQAPLGGNSRVFSYDWTGFGRNLVVAPLENFEAVGQRLIATIQSDTSWILTSDPTLRFPAPAGESNTYSGMAILDTGISRFEVHSMDRYVLPKQGANVYVELDYQCSVPLSVGVIAYRPGQIIQMPTATLNPSSAWNHAYINLVTEVSGVPDANDFRIFLGSIKAANGKLDTVLVDNVRLVYRP